MAVFGIRQFFTNLKIDLFPLAYQISQTLDVVSRVILSLCKLWERWRIPLGVILFHFTSIFFQVCHHKTVLQHGAAVFPVDKSLQHELNVYLRVFRPVFASVAGNRAVLDTDPAFGVWSRNPRAGLKGSNTPKILTKWLRTVGVDKTFTCSDYRKMMVTEVSLRITV